jgi:hypothetical protein
VEIAQVMAPTRVKRLSSGTVDKMAVSPAVSKPCTIAARMAMFSSGLYETDRLSGKNEGKSPFSVLRKIGNYFRALESPNFYDAYSNIFSRFRSSLRVEKPVDKSSPEANPRFQQASFNHQIL